MHLEFSIEVFIGPSQCPPTASFLSEPHQLIVAIWRDVEKRFDKLLCVIDSEIKQRCDFELRACAIVCHIIVFNRNHGRSFTAFFKKVCNFICCNCVQFTPTSLDVVNRRRGEDGGGVSACRR